MTADQLSDAILATGLLSADELRDLAAEWRPEGERSSAAWSEWLLAHGRLTPFQIRELLAGGQTPLVLGDYVLVDRIGAGGMGQVFRAQHRHMDRPAAIKLLPPALTRDAAAVQRFQREVKAAARLTHPNIVQTYDASVQRGVWYLVMECVHGRDLASLLADRGPFPPLDAIEIVRQAARGLAYAHGKGVVHRDIKPGNLLLDEDGVVKILDMGLARFEDPAGQEGLTQSGQVMGTVDYMAPEQAFDTHSADARADIYSLGCTLYRLLTGKALYEGETLVQKLMKHQTAPIPSLLEPRAASAPLPMGEGGRRPGEGITNHDFTALNAIFQKMVAKRPEERFQSMEEVEAALAEIAGGAARESSPAAQDSKLTRFFHSLGGKQPTAIATLAAAVAPARQDVSPTVSFRGPQASTDPVSDRSIQIAREAPPLSAATRLPGHAPLLAAVGIAMVAAVTGGLGLWNWLGAAATHQPASLGAGAAPAVPPKRANPPAASPPPAAVAQPPELSAEGFRPLFNGRDLAGWSTLEGGAGSWQVVDGAITCSGPRSYLFSEQEFEDFHLRVEAKVNDGGNSGVFFRCRRVRGDRGDPPGFEAQIASTHADPQRTGGLYNLVRVQEMLVPPEEWFTLEVIAAGPRIRVLVNGRQTADHVDAERVFQRGPLALQFFGDPSRMAFRKIEIRDLPPATGETSPAAVVSTPPSAKAPFDSAKARRLQEAWAKHLGTEVEIENSVGMPLVLIPPGEFQMGRLPGEANLFPRNSLYTEPAATRHSVTISQPCFLGATEVTQRQWREVMQTEPWLGKAMAVIGDDYPANFNTKAEAQEFCRRLSVTEGASYRLPTEAEWEHACRAGTETLYFFGAAHGQLGDYACRGALQPVRTKKANPWGLYDVYGNVWEWVADGHNDFTAEAAVDPQLAPGNPRSILRGSCFRSVIPAEFSSGARHSWPNTLALDEKGFRVLREAVKESPPK